MLRKAQIIVLLVIAASSSAAQTPKGGDAIERAAQAIGADGLTSIKYSGSGFNFALGQSVRPFAPWPKFNVKSYERAIDYNTATSREEMVRTQFENPPRGGGAQPIIGEQRQVQLVSGNYAWNVAGGNATPAPAARIERSLQIWITPHGFVKAAQANNPQIRTARINGHRVDMVSFLVDGKFKVNGAIDDQGLIEKVETWIPNPILGDMLVETLYSDYKDLGGIKFPTRIVQKQGGFPTLDISVTSVERNAGAVVAVPNNVRAAAAASPRVEVQKLADGVWYLTGGTHHSVLVQFKDHLVVIEAPLNDERSMAIIAEAKKLAPNKPIRYVVATHHHFDHSGGVGAYVGEGSTIITHQMNRIFFERSLRAPRTLSSDKHAKSKRLLKLMTMTEKRVLTDGGRVLELYHIKGSTHNEGIIMAYMPKEKLLIEADVYTPAAANTTAPPAPSPFTLNLYENLQQLHLDVEQIAPLHGRLVAMADLLKAIGKAP